MNLSRILNICCIIFGGIIALYAQAEKEQNQYILIIGIILLMFGVYRISRGVSSKIETPNTFSSLDEKPSKFENKDLEDESR